MSATPRQHVFPPPMERHYRIENDRIQTRSLEAHIVDHCNLTCAECCSLSPLLPAWLAEPQALTQDLARAAKVLAPRVFKLVGGEPLLHPALVDILQRVRRAGIAPEVSVTTNGLLLGRMPEAFWEHVDALTISLYPRPRLATGLIAHIETQAARFHVRLNWKVQDSFVRMTREQVSDDKAEVQGVYHDCWIRERCHMIRNGIFYTCTRPAHFDTLHRGRQDFRSDGIALRDDARMLQDLLAYLQREQPLKACFHCYGGAARMEPHRLMTHAEIETIKQLAQ
jgi:GTP 3',8-cyclase